MVSYVSRYPEHQQSISSSPLWELLELNLTAEHQQIRAALDRLVSRPMRTLALKTLSWDILASALSRVWGSVVATQGLDRASQNFVPSGGGSLFLACCWGVQSWWSVLKTLGISGFQKVRGCFA